MTKEPLSKIEETIRGHNDFLIEIAENAGAEEDIALCVKRLSELNKAGKYESFMATRWTQLEWWMAAAINYNLMTLNRIQTNHFHTGQLKKIESNTLQKSKKPKQKAELVQRWLDYCKRESLDPYIFEMARINGIDVYA